MICMPYRYFKHLKSATILQYITAHTCITDTNALRYASSFKQGQRALRFLRTEKTFCEPNACVCVLLLQI